MHRTRFNIEVTAPVRAELDWSEGQRLAEVLEETLPAGSTVEVRDTEVLEEDA